LVGDFDELLPFVEDRLEVSGERLLMGPSLGGLVSAIIALERPDLFDAVMAQSGAFLGTPAERDHYRSKDAWLLDEIERSAPKPLRWYLECGRFEWLLEVNRKLAAALGERGNELEYRERNAGHNWVNWRNGLSGALRFALATGR
jgi:enterochelin esterase-like enzyme